MDRSTRNDFYEGVIKRGKTCKVTCIFREGPVSKENQLDQKRGVGLSYQNLPLVNFCVTEEEFFFSTKSYFKQILFGKNHVNFF